jgi:tRNA nucleotidyltransferase/poly(A) polymerase
LTRPTAATKLLAPSPPVGLAKNSPAKTPMSEPISEQITGLLADPLRDQIVRSAGSVPCHLVGGAVRDRLTLQRNASDWDLIVAEDGQEIARRLAGALDGRLIELGREPLVAYRVVGSDRTLDFWDRRGEGLAAELARRDLTINSIAVDLRLGDVEDPQGGLDDLAGGILRANSSERFLQDPLRVLRLLRLSQLLPGFEIESGTRVAARAAAGALGEVASERVRTELEQSLSFLPAPKLAGRLKQLDLFPRLWDETSPPRVATDQLTTADGILRALTGPETVPEKAVLSAMRHAVLLRTLGILQGSSDRFEYESSRLERLLEKGYISRTANQRIAHLLEARTPPTSERERRRFIAQFGPSWPAAASLAGLAVEQADAPRTWLTDLTETYQRHGAVLVNPPRLLTGADLERDFGIAPGRRMGRLLQALKQAHIEGLIASENEAREWLQHYLGDSPPGKTAT